MELEFFEKSLFLCEYKSIKEFAKIFNECFKSNYTTQWSIVCERKEDLITVRNQVLFEIEQLQEKNPHNSEGLFGISMYTLDNLARNFCATIAATTNKNIINEIPKFITKPYLDVINQEHFIKNVLNFYGYLGNDSLPLAKQILSLLDISWPEDASFAKLLISTQDLENISAIQEINEKVLKQILATYQFTKLEFEKYSRLQSLVKEYLQEKFSDHIQENDTNLILPLKFLNGHILWISAPEYINSHSKEIPNDIEKFSGSTIKPGNFQSYFVDEFKKSILTARKILNVKSTSFLTSRTVIFDSHNDVQIDQSHIHYYVSENRHCYSENIESVLINQENTICLLADFDPGKFRETRPDAAGRYPMSSQFIAEWNKNNLKFLDAEEIYPQIDSHFDNFLEQLSLIDNESKFDSIGKKYSLEIKKRDENFISHLFLKNMESEYVQIGQQHPVLNCPKALSYFASPDIPKKIIAIGRAHAPTGSSFHVKVLNNAISILRKQGVSIDLPASELMYRGFWKNISNLKIPLEFWLENSEELQQFPNYLLPKENIFKFGKALPPSAHSHLINRFSYSSNDKKILIPNWKSELFDINKNISITSFEKYIQCPLQFFLSEVLNIKKEEQEELSIDNKEIGSRMHVVAEQFMTRLVTLLGNYNYEKIMPSIYKNILNSLKIEENFLSSNKDQWKKIINNCIIKESTEFKKEIQITFEEAIDNIWDVFKNENKMNFTLIQEREILKRTFFRFLNIEYFSIENHPNRLTGIERERPISLELEEMTFTGKIDRIDAHENGLSIIDYKTSNIPKTEKKISLFPSELKEVKGSKLSAQGGLYCLAWAQKKLLEEEENHSRSQIISFSLYHLKNLDEKSNPIISYEFSSLLKKNNETYEKLRKEYSQFALRLKQGDFYPNPIKKDTCNFCDFKVLCPTRVGLNTEEIESFDED
ncbi:PD-(D/E)XK nuclease family protein [Silvanigrella aquatica]|uniref:PD-(D/E)XK endonuclease-like domain-containing protein n=1 Tax=Silvanigrella aquatica TaxID=1915309 RepID=A0A1L4D0P3_9BACT|nr:PD-(D/E)XK nuclease family protein [Silvanigrella aquatica]APJ03769.1 hypothetical protein AXG55_07560 [Silvanigrella aquatica]